jgi:hypothetical protein
MRKRQAQEEQSPVPMKQARVVRGVLLDSDDDFDE